jgi:hypothetical protein
MVAAGVRRGSFAALMVSVVLGCSSSAHNPSCKVQGDCASGLTCSASECVAVGECASTQSSCSDNSTCAGGTSCINNCCAAFAGCRSGNDCVSTPNTPVCNTTTSTCAACGGNSDCLAGTICTAPGACAQGCAAEANCAQGQQCLTGANGKFCAPQGSTPTIALTPATGAFIRAGDSFGSTFPTRLTVTLAFTATIDSAVTVTAADADVVIANSGVVTIPAGQTSAEVKLSATSPHASELLTATLGASTSTATIRVLGAAEAPATLTLTPAAPTLAVGANQTFTLTADLPVPPGSIAALDYGANASLFSVAPASVAFTADTLTQTFVATVDPGASSGQTTVRATLGALTATSSVSVVALAAGSCAPVNSPLVVSMIFGDGGFTGAAWNNDFVEIHNRSNAPVSLNGLSVQYAAATSTTTIGSGNVVVLPNVSLQAGQYFLIAGAAGTATDPALPTPDASLTTLNMSFSNGKVFLVNGTTGMSFTGDATSETPSGTVLDAVGYGTTNFGEGSARSPVMTASAWNFRNNLGCDDTDQNGSDWSQGTPAPRNTSSPAITCKACGGTQ